METNEYEMQANKFAERYGVKMEILKMREGIYFDDAIVRDIYTIQITRGKEVYTFDFGQSIDNRNKRINATPYEKVKRAWMPTFYDIFSCFTKYDPGDFLDFCECYGYEANRKSMTVYKNVCREYEAMVHLFPEENIMNEFREIC